MRKIWKGLALVSLAGLGLAVSAFGAQARPSWHWPPVTTTTAPATTTTAPATTTTTTTAVTTTTTTAATTTTATSPSSVKLIAPLNGTPYTRGSTALGVGEVHSTTGGVVCSFDWGDQSAASVSTASEVSPGVYRCTSVHPYYTLTGYLIVRLVATDANGAVVGEDSITVFVI